MMNKLDQSCGINFIFRDLIACGETQAKTGIKNIPTQDETFQALEYLVVNVLDPVVKKFGKIELTYGFCSRELASKIKGHIYPKLDQHASHELNTRGNIICDRLGAAVDFKINGVSSLEISKWIVDNTPFDRLYFYGR